MTVGMYVCVCLCTLHDSVCVCVRERDSTGGEREA